MSYSYISSSYQSNFSKFKIADPDKDNSTNPVHVELDAYQRSEMRSNWVSHWIILKSCWQSNTSSRPPTGSSFAANSSQTNLLIVDNLIQAALLSFTVYDGSWQVDNDVLKIEIWIEIPCDCPIIGCSFLKFDQYGPIWSQYWGVQ